MGTVRPALDICLNRLGGCYNIKNEGLRILALGTSVTALGGNVRPKPYGRKSTAVEAVALELGSPRSTR